MLASASAQVQRRVYGFGGMCAAAPAPKRVYGLGRRAHIFRIGGLSDIVRVTA